MALVYKEHQAVAIYAKKKEREKAKTSTQSIYKMVLVINFNF